MVVSLLRGESNRAASELLTSSNAKLSTGRVSSVGLEAAGNLKVLGNVPDSGRLVNGSAGSPGVFGAVAIPACRRIGLSGKVASAVFDDQEDSRGEGCVEDRWPRGATWSETGQLTTRVDSPEGGPPLACLLGTICRLADRPCPLEILRDPSAALLRLAPSSTALSLCPIDMIETERLCVLPSLPGLPGPPAHDPEPGCDPRPTLTGALSERVVRCPRFGGVGLGLSVLLFLSCGGAPFLCLSPAGAKPFAGGGCSEVLGVAGLVAIFLKVIWHSMSSPAKTVCSVHCTKTLMLVDILTGQGPRIKVKLPLFEGGQLS